jgi:DNA-binding CsgD family transcriptional regulator
VKNHINHVYAKLGTRNRAEAIALWLGLTDPVDR